MRLQEPAQVFKNEEYYYIHEEFYPHCSPEGLHYLCNLVQCRHISISFQLRHAQSISDVVSEAYENESSEETERSL